jgi:putative endonuclease
MAASTFVTRLAGLAVVGTERVAALGGAWLVYILRCADGTLYTGCTNHLGRRLRRHLGGGVKYTRGRLPVEPIYVEEVAGRSEALKREAAIKKLRRERKLEVAIRSRP